MRRLVILAAMLAMVSAGCGGDDKPTTPTPTGACCVLAGTCTVTTQAACSDTWSSGAVCTPNPCQQPTGSCCAADGTCAVAVQTACTGTWTMFGVCDPDPCQQPTGSCCAPVGTCTVTTQVNCTGNWTQAGICAPNPCPQPGSCCAPDGTCTVTTSTACTGTSIWTLAGVCEPNPCTQPPQTGSCCATVGSCTVTTEANCTGTSRWTLAGVCMPNPCLTPPPPGMVWIPPGNVRLGQVGVRGAEPVNDFYVDGFWIDIDEVSNVKYKAFIDAGGYTTEAYWNSVGWAWRMANGITLPEYWNETGSHGGGIAGNEQFPATGVSWFEADAYCRWAGGRLPTEAEWEKAAKGGCETHGDPGTCDASDTPTYPWGEGISDPQANYYQSGDPSESNGWTTLVGYYDGSNHGGYQTINSPSPYGLYDVVGNVREWCSTKYENYPYNPNDGRENPPVSYDECCRVLRGGSFNSNYDSYYLRCACRDFNNPDYRFSSVGFRCVRTGS